MPAYAGGGQYLGGKTPKKLGDGMARYDPYRIEELFNPDEIESHAENDLVSFLIEITDFLDHQASAGHPIISFGICE